MLECNHCKKSFGSVYTLKRHENTAKFCMKSRGIQKTYKCICEKDLSSIQALKRHQEICSVYLVNKKTTELQEIITKKDEENNNLQQQLQEQKSAYETQISELLSLIENISVKSISKAHQEVAKIKQKYCKKQERTQYPGENFVYIITTDLLESQRRYILGKATDLTKRLSTYNKTDEHKVIFYSNLPTKDKMSICESLLFDKLDPYREKSNRERFILPPDKDISYFIQTLQKCTEFIN